MNAMARRIAAREAASSEFGVGVDGSDPAGVDGVSVDQDRALGDVERGDQLAVCADANDADRVMVAAPGDPLPSVAPGLRRPVDLQLELVHLQQASRIQFQCRRQVHIHRLLLVLSRRHVG
jgi:hypothetical protein